MEKKVVVSENSNGGNGTIAAAMRVAEEKKAASMGVKSGRLNIGAIKIAILSPEDAALMAEAIRENRQYAESLGQTKAELEKAIRDIVAMATAQSDGGDDAAELLANEHRKVLMSNEAELAKIDAELKRLEKHEPGVRAHADLAHLIRQVEVEIEVVQSGKRLDGAAHYLREVIRVKRFRYATDQEKSSARGGKGASNAPSHLVFFGGIAVVPLELTAANKLLAERLMALCKAEKAIVVKEIATACDDLKSQATHSLADAIAGEIGGAVVYCRFPKRQLPDGKWLSGGQLLLKVEETDKGKRLMILGVAGAEFVVREYGRMKAEGRFLPLVFVKAGKITSYIEEQQLFNDTRMFLRDVQRGLEQESKELDKQKVIAEKKAITEEVAAQMGIDLSAEVEAEGEDGAIDTAPIDTKATSGVKEGIA